MTVDPIIITAGERVKYLNSCTCMILHNVYIELTDPYVAMYVLCTHLYTFGTGWNYIVIVCIVKLMCILIDLQSI